MRFKLKKHNYETHFADAISTRISKWFGAYKMPTRSFVSHGENCCNYWQLMTIKDLMQDDILTTKGEL